MLFGYTKLLQFNFTLLTIIKTAMRVYTLLILLVLVGLSMGYGQQLPADFPKYVDTGDKERDVLNYDMQKKAWITTHTEKYIAMQPGLSEEGKEILQKKYLLRKDETTTVLKEQPKREDFINDIDFHVTFWAWMKSNRICQKKIAYEDFILMSDDERAKIEEVPELFQIVKRSEIESK